MGIEKQHRRGAATPAGELASDFTASLGQDSRLYREETAVSIAHARMLARQKIIPSDAADALADALGRIRAEIERGEFKWRADLEDIHMNIEARLYELVGDAAGWLHTARSRNDLIATDTRLYVKRVASDAVAALVELQATLVARADEHIETLLPAYTHLQRGQPTALAHHLLAYYEMLRRDARRFEGARDMADELPLGAGAATGSPYPIDQEFMRKELGFARISANSIDAVSDRDYIADFVYAAALCMTHLSRLADELVLWSAAEFGFARLADEYTTGSSIMPQKRNPDFAELTRGRAGRTYGALVNLLTTLKGLPLTYNRDLQEDKPPLFDAADTLLPCLRAVAGMIRTADFDAARMRAALDDASVLATDIADYLTRKGMPFRDAYALVKRLDADCRAAGRTLADLTLADYRAASPLFDADVTELTVEKSVAARQTIGGSAPERVRAQIARAKDEIERLRKRAPNSK